MIFKAGSKTQTTKRAIRFGAIVVFVSLGSFAMTGIGSYTANAATDALVTEAFIVGAMGIDCSAQELNFGDIVATGVAGTVAVDTLGGATDGGGATYISGAAAGVCLLSGNVSAAYEIDYVINDLTGPGANMTVTSLDSDNANGDGPFVGVGTHTASLDAGGADTLTIGATLNVGINQLAGTYNGTIDVTVDYP